MTLKCRNTSSLFCKISVQAFFFSFLKIFTKLTPQKRAQVHIDMHIKLYIFFFDCNQHFTQRDFFNSPPLNFTEIRSVAVTYGQIDGCLRSWRARVWEKNVIICIFCTQRGRSYAQCPIDGVNISLNKFFGIARRQLHTCKYRQSPTYAVLKK